MKRWGLLATVLLCMNLMFSAYAEISIKRIMVIANKNWEVAPLLEVLSEPPLAGAYAPNFPIPYINNNSFPFIPTNITSITNPVPRMVFAFTNMISITNVICATNVTDGIANIPDCVTNVISVTNIVHAEIWCIQDWMSPQVSSSNSKEKMNVLPRLFRWNGQTNANIVIAFGTASFPSADSYNGNVVLGGNAFVHDPFRTNTVNTNYFHDVGTETLIPATNVSAFFSPALIDSVRTASEPRFIIPPMEPAHKLTVIAAMNYTAVSGINITDYNDYAWADPAALNAFAEATGSIQDQPPAGSLETTHGLIALQCKKLSCPFIFVSAITDRLGYFNMEVAPRNYAQNFACAHNAGVVVAWLLPQIPAVLR